MDACVRAFRLRGRDGRGGGDGRDGRGGRGGRMGGMMGGEKERDSAGLWCFRCRCYGFVAALLD